MSASTVAQPRAGKIGKPQRLHHRVTRPRVRIRRDIQAPWGLVVGQVALWGNIIEHERGWRARFG